MTKHNIKKIFQTIITVICLYLTTLCSAQSFDEFISQCKIPDTNLLLMQTLKARSFVSNYIIKDPIVLLQGNEVEFEQNPYNYTFKPLFVNFTAEAIKQLNNITQKRVKVKYPHVDIYSWFIINRLIQNPKCGFKGVLDNVITQQVEDGRVNRGPYNDCYVCRAQSYFITTDKDLEKSFFDNNIPVTSEYQKDNIQYYNGGKNNLITLNYMKNDRRVSYDESGAGQYFWFLAISNLYKCNFNYNETKEKIDFQNTEVLYKLIQKIDLKVGFQKICQGCAKECEKCDISDQQKCYKCKNSNYYLKDNKCQTCSQDCDKCRLGDDGQSEICLSCNQGFLLINNKCQKIDKCPEAYFKIENTCCPLRTSLKNGVCVPCDKFCLDCKYTQQSEDKYEYTCNQCMEQYIYQVDKCLRPCEPGNFYDRRDCLQCTQKYCDFCRGIGNQDCFQCFRGFILQKIDDGTMQCVKCTSEMNCDGDNFCSQIGQYRELLYPYECKPCKDHCIQCSTGTDCQKCEKGFILKDGSCNKQNQGQYLDSETQQSNSCHFSCSKCEDSSKLCNECSNYSKYYIEHESGKKWCFDLCPQNYVKFTTSNSNQNSYKCVLKPELQDQVYAYTFKQECPPSHFKINNQCNQCSENCLQCFNLQECSTCIVGFYLNKSINKCQPCHSTCKTCKGPLLTDCLTCKTTSSEIPNSESKCIISSAKQDIKIQSLLLQKDILNYISSGKNGFVKSDNTYSVNFSILYSTQDQDWKQLEFLSSQDSVCDFSFFKKMYSSNNFESVQCQQNQINRSIISQDGHLTVLLTSILARQSIKLRGQLINPKALLQYAQSEYAVSTSYVYKMKQIFECNLLKCQSQINFSQLSFVQGENTVKIQGSKKITFVSKAKELNCQNPQLEDVDIQQLQQFEEIVSTSQMKNPSEINRFFIINVCGQTDDQQMQTLPFLATSQLGQGFYNVFSPNQNSSQNPFTLFTSGADLKQNNYFKEKYPGYKNPFIWYKVISVSIYEIKNYNANTNIPKQYFEKFVQKINQQIIQTPPNSEPLKQFACEKLLYFIQTNDFQGGNFVTQLTQKDKIITQSITRQIFEPLLKIFNITLKDFLSLDSIQSQTLSKKVFEAYIDQISIKTLKCYPISERSTCLKNIFIDIVYSNNGICFEEAKISAFLKVNDYLEIANLLKQSKWCNENKYRCNRSNQILLTEK